MPPLASCLESPDIILRSEPVERKIGEEIRRGRVFKRYEYEKIGGRKW